MVRHLELEANETRPVITVRRKPMQGQRISREQKTRENRDFRVLVPRNELAVSMIGLDRQRDENITLEVGIGVRPRLAAVYPASSAVQRRRQFVDTLSAEFDFN